MKKDIPIQAGTPNVVTGVPEIKMTTGDFTKQWTDIFTKMAKDVYAIGNQFLEVDREIEENKEFMDVNQKILEKRKLYSDEFENPEKIDLNNAEWRKQRDEALKKLREEEFQIIRYSKINNISKDKFADTSNTYYMEKSVKNNMVYGEFTRQNNLSRATNNIIDSIELIGKTDNESERVGLVNSINNSRGILIKYGVPEADVNANIMKNLRESLTIASKNEIDNLFNSYDPDVAYIKAQELIGLNAQKYTALLGKVDGIKEEKAEEILKNYYNEQKDIFSGYIENKKKRNSFNIKAQERALKKAKDTENKIRTYIKSGNSYKLARELTGIEYTTEEMVNDNYTLNEIYGVDMEVLGDANNNSVGKIVAKEDIDKLKRDIQAYKNNGYTSNSAVREVVYSYANSMAGDNIEIKNGILKHLGKELKINPTVLLKGEEDNNYFEVQEKLNKGKNFEFNGEVKTSFFSNKSKERYDKLIMTLGNTEKAKKTLDSYIYGLYVDDSILDEKSLKLNPGAVIQSFLSVDQRYEELKEKLKYINELGVAPVKYEYMHIKAENFNINKIVTNQIEETKTTTTEIQEDNGDMYEF